ncbi:MAG: cation:proton antiporter [Balneolales bacterium]
MLLDKFFSLPISDPVLIFALVMFIILVTPLIFDKIRIPSIVGLILAGTIVGPSVMGLLIRDDTIILLGTVGLLYLMFMAGLSIDLNKFEKLRSRSLVFGLLSFFIPQIASIIVGFYFLNFSLPTTFLVGSIVGSHTLLAYPIASRLGITKNSAATTTIGGTIITDALSLTVLAIVVAAAVGDINTQFWITFVGSVSVYMVLVFVGLPWLGRWYFKRATNQTNTEYVFLIAVLFITAYLAQIAGLAAIIGAFLAGLAMNKLVPESSTLMNRVMFVGNALFIPFFLISVGMIVDVSVLGSSDVLIYSLTFTLLVVVGKTLGAKATQWIYNYNSAEGWVMSGLSIPQAAATLAVTLIGFDLGYLNEAMVNGVVVLILITSVIGPWLVETYGRKVALLEEKKPYNPSEAPQRILIPLANPATSEALMDLSMMVRYPDSDQPIFPLIVARDTIDVEAQVAAGEKILSHAVVHASAANIPVIPVTRVDMNIASGIVRAIKEMRISSVIIGWNGQSSTRRSIFGSVLDQLLDQTDEMTLVCKLEQPLNTTERVILAVPPLSDREPGFNGALNLIKTLVNQLGAELKVISTDVNDDIIEEFLSKKDPEIKAEFEILDDWSKIVKKSQFTLDENDLVILLSARKGSISWQPNLERLPKLIVYDYPSVNILTVYPSEERMEDSSVLQIYFGRSSKLPSIETSNITLKIEELSYKEALHKMLENYFHNKEKALDVVIDKLLKVDPDNTQRELPNVLLTHTASYHVNEPTFFLGLSSNGINYEKIPEPVKVIVVLISPKGLPLQRSLNILGKITQMLYTAEVVEKLSKSTTVQEIRDILSAKLVFKEEVKNSSISRDK